MLLLLMLLLLGSARVATPNGSTSDTSLHTVVIGEVRHTVRPDFLSYTWDSAQFCDAQGTIKCASDRTTQLRAAHLAPMTLRVSGSFTDREQFSEGPYIRELASVVASGERPTNPRPQCNVTGATFDAIAKFARAIGAPLVWGLNAILREGATPTGPFDSRNAEVLMQHDAKMGSGATVAAFEHGNEPEQWCVPLECAALKCSSVRSIDVIEITVRHPRRGHNYGVFSLTPAIHAKDGAVLRHAIRAAGYTGQLPTILGPATAVARCPSNLTSYDQCIKLAKRGVPPNGSNYNTCMCQFDYLEEFLRGFTISTAPVDAVTFHSYPLSAPGEHVQVSDLRQQIGLLNLTRAAVGGVRAAVDKTLGHQFPIQCLECSSGLRNAGGAACHAGMGPDGKFHVPPKPCGVNLTFELAEMDMAGSLAMGGAEKHARQALNSIVNFICGSGDGGYVTPGYWIALLFKHVMGTQVRHVQTAGAPETLRAYAHGTNSSSSTFLGVMLLNFDHLNPVHVQLRLPRDVEYGEDCTQRIFKVTSGPDVHWPNNSDVKLTPGILINGEAPSFSDGVAEIQPFEAPSTSCDGKVTLVRESLAFVSFKVIRPDGQG